MENIEKRWKPVILSHPLGIANETKQKIPV